MDLSKMNKEELMNYRKKLTIKRSNIDKILDNQAFNKDMSNTEIEELEEEYEKCEEEIIKIDALLNTRSR